MAVNISKKFGKLVALSPYNSELPSRAKKIGGKWSPDLKGWVFDLRDEIKVRELYVNVYGTDGTQGIGDIVTLRIELDKCYFEAVGRGSKVELCGRIIARRMYRDSEVKLSDGVVITSGDFPSSGGSVKNPAIDAKGCEIVLEVRDVPRVKAAEIIEYYEGVSIIDQGVDVLALEAEKSALLKRLSEINKLLA